VLRGLAGPVVHEPGQSVDAAGDTGFRPSVALEDDGRVQVAYSDATSDDLRYARREDRGCVRDER
jgi:hypothetical protein